MNKVYNNPHPLADETQENISAIGPAIISAKIEQQAIFAQSAIDGGPTDTQSIIINLMEACKIGYRSLALETGRKRKLLQEMIQGTKPIPPEVVSELWHIFEKRRPDLFKNT